MPRLEHTVIDTFQMLMSTERSSEEWNEILQKWLLSFYADFSVPINCTSITMFAILNDNAFSEEPDKAQGKLLNLFN